ncbi:PREDICTED: E3 SUMO-protein ligase SIZ1-like isoform X3 [Ipomoea nil]|uniref:E3 SUMO-protein ligase SIZ1-like isoform X3 n=2 Tax=Ipomoea nil TaxID=35883 RepID=UPI000901C16A|nr:PREDICTED: E3 SUMO-protein ligase SIZ1-like isoform X3 [Ipomoea nil]
MDLLGSCKDKLTYFRIKELKDVLTQLGVSKQGKKQDLVDRILTILSDEQVSGVWAKKNAFGKEQVAKIVDDIYRKMQVSGAPDLASKLQGFSDSSSAKFKDEIEDSYKMDKIQCPCGSTLQTDSMIKCEDPKCHVWQHISCVIIPEKARESGIPPIPPGTFYCELCRLRRADPFLVPVANPLPSVKLTVTDVPPDGTNPVQSIEKTFQLTRADRDLLAKQEYDLQAWCMLLNDMVHFRMQWPLHTALQFNGVTLRAINRPGTQLLGANGRDDGPIITPCIRDGINKISLTGVDARVFCFGVRIVKRRTVQQILNCIPKESVGERFEDALARVCRVGGGNATENADSDSDIEVVDDYIPVNLRCPMSGSRIKVAGRFKPCVHKGCFDLEVFVEMNQRTRKWQCPICLKNYSLEHIIIDPYLNRIASKLRNCGEDVTEIEVKPDGSWRANVEGDRNSLGDLGLWHLPNGNLYTSSDADSKPKPEILKQEGGSNGHGGLRVGLKKNPNGIWEVSKSEDVPTLTNKMQDNFVSGQGVIPMSSSATGSGKEGEDRSVNQDAIGILKLPTNNGIDFESVSLDLDCAYGISDRNPSILLGEAEVITLSDSDEENEPPMLHGNVQGNNRIDSAILPFPLQQHGIPDSYHEDPAFANEGNSCPGLFGTSNNDFEMHTWHLSHNTQGGPGYQLFGSDADVSGSFAVVQPQSIDFPSSIDCYGFLTDDNIGSVGVVPDSSVGCHNANINDGLIVNSMSFGGADPPLQIFLPTRPSNAATDTNTRDQPDVTNGVQTEDWFSLTLGSGGIRSRADSAAANGLTSDQQLQSKDGGLYSLTDTVSLLGMNDNKCNKMSRERSDNPFSFPRKRRSARPRSYPFSFPRKRRSARPRSYLSVNSDSESINYRLPCAYDK